MKVGGFFVFLVRHPKHHQKKEKPKVKILIALALFAASIVGALARMELPDGRHLRAAALAQLTK